MRLDKYLTTIGIGSRSQSKQLIKKGKIKVNNEIINKPEFHVDENKDVVSFDDVNLEYHRFYYYMLNKPTGVISATEDFQCKTVMDIMDVTPKNGLFPVGRLDKDTEGLLLITNDGELSHCLLSPSKHVEKTYFVRTDGVIKQEYVPLFKEGFDIGEKKITKPSNLYLINENSAYITITEGKYHQVKRMFKHFKLNVIYLKRISMGPLKLDENLAVGEYRLLYDNEIKELLKYKN